MERTESAEWMSIIATNQVLVDPTFTGLSVPRPTALASRRMSSTIQASAAEAAKSNPWSKEQQWLTWPSSFLTFSNKFSHRGPRKKRTWALTCQLVATKDGDGHFQPNKNTMKTRGENARERSLLRTGQKCAYKKVRQRRGRPNGDFPWLHKESGSEVCAVTMGPTAKNMATSWNRTGGRQLHQSPSLKSSGFGPRQVKCCCRLWSCFSYQHCCCADSLLNKNAWGKHGHDRGATLEVYGWNHLPSSRSAQYPAFFAVPCDLWGFSTNRVLLEIIWLLWRCCCCLKIEYVVDRSFTSTSKTLLIRLQPSLPGTVGAFVFSVCHWCEALHHPDSNEGKIHFHVGVWCIGKSLISASLFLHRPWVRG